MNAQGDRIPCECSVRQRESDGQVVRAVAARDIRERLAAEAEIRQLAHFDALTGLCNRRLLLEQVTQELVEVERHQRRAALAVLNLNAFQSVNDSLGMAAGDTVLRTVARRLSALQSQGQTLARVDGDSFALLLTGLDGSLEVASARAARDIEILLAAIAEPIEVDGHTLHLNAGAGLVMIPNDSSEPLELLREAETAMHLAKEARDSRVRFFAHALQEAASSRLALRNDLRGALKQSAHGEPPHPLLLHYQPQVDAHGQLQGVEALVRWQHPVRGLIPPGAFIAEAEASGLIVPLGNWVLEEAANCLRRWQSNETTQAWAQHLSMAVNVSPRQFREPDFIARIEDVLERVGINALSLELELTESVVADDLESTLEKIEVLRRLGVRFALDDFGTGYSSLSYLKRLPIDTLKIDRSFVMDIDAPEQTQSGKRPAVLINAIVAMAHQLDLHVLAEGVETPTQLARLVQVGCDSFQGYHFSRPLPESALCAWAAQHAGGSLPRTL
jgi:diguanylate cyclase (GGDEF)-like protein